MIEHRFLYSTKNFSKSSFYDAMKFRNARLQMVQSQTEGLNVFLRIRGMVKQGLGSSLITSSCSHFVNENDLEQYLFKMSQSI